MIDFGTHRMTIEMMYTDRMTVTTLQTSVDPDTLEKTETWVPQTDATDIPCHMDYNQAVTKEGVNVTRQELSISVMLAPEPMILPGSRIAVTTEAGRVWHFEQSTPAKVVPSHQIIDVSLLQEVV